MDPASLPSAQAAIGGSGRPAGAVAAARVVPGEGELTSWSSTWSSVPVGSTAEVDTHVNGERIRAERRARELVAEMHWRGMVVPSVYTRMAAEFQDLIAAGDYAAWVATGGTPRSRATRAGRHLPSGRA